jgi:hypothetical protein
LDIKEYKSKSSAVFAIPYKTRYWLLKKEKERLKNIEIDVPSAYQAKIRKRLQPNCCFKESIKFAMGCSTGVTFLFKWQKFPVINDKSYQLLVAFYIPITKLSLAASTTSTVILSI